MAMVMNRGRSSASEPAGAEQKFHTSFSPLLVVTGRSSYVQGVAVLYRKPNFSNTEAHSAPKAFFTQSSIMGMSLKE